MTMTARPPLTKRQKAVYRWIVNAYAERGYGIGVREIAEAFGWASPTAALRYVLLLDKRGYVTRVPGRANSIVPIGGDA
jgi:SOS-response transcriptional repressor LexA